MHVVATAGHVDHGKSTLVRALTGMEPDRWAQERRRGMTIDLGFAWTTLPSGARLAFVDVPGHERFVTNMLGGLGPVPAVMVVVAADEGWMPQSAEHLAAIEALGVRDGLLVVTRADLADPARALGQARGELAGTALHGIEAVAVSGATGAGLPELRGALERMCAALPAPRRAGPVRIWIDRAFTVKGSGTVVTGTLPAGTVTVGDELLLGSRPVRIRGLQSLKEQVDSATAVARVAANLRGVDRADVHRGQALITPEAWTMTSILDVGMSAAPPQRPPEAAAGAGTVRDPSVLSGSGHWSSREAILHLGSAAVAARVRPLGPGTARLTLRRPLPLHVGDSALLRDPGSRQIIGVTVLDVTPPPLRRRGAAAARGAELGAVPDAATILRRAGVLRRTELAAMGLGAPEAALVVDDWLADPGHWGGLAERLKKLVAERAAADPVDPGVPVEAARAALGLPDRRLVTALVDGVEGLDSAGGRVAGVAGLPPEVVEAVGVVRAELAAAPFRAPVADRLDELGLTPKVLAAAARAGTLLKIADGIVLAPQALALATAVLSGLAQPFTVSEARQALDTSRRVAIPLLEYLDRHDVTLRLDDGRRRLVHDWQSVM